MRLGARTTMISKGSLAHYLYGSLAVSERHRHRYEVNPDYIKRIQAAGGRFTGIDDQKQRMEIFEVSEDHPYFISCQFHPEFLSRPLAPSPVFMGLLLASSKQLNRSARSEALPPMHATFNWVNTGDALTAAESKSDNEPGSPSQGSRSKPLATPKLFLPGSPMKASAHPVQAVPAPDLNLGPLSPTKN